MSKKHIFIGIECQFSNLHDIWEFLKFPGIEFGSRKFVTVDAAVYAGSRITIPPSFESTYFQELINLSFVAERLVLHVYSDISFAKDIDDYADYLQCNCEMIILIYDGFYVEIYCKNQLWLESLLQTAQRLSGVRVDKKYEDTDTRTGMYV